MTDDADFRTERDTLGEVRIPRDARWGPQTQRAVENFPVSGRAMPRGFLRALGLVKACAARVNADLGGLDADVAAAVAAAAQEVAAGAHDAHFPVDVFQTGSGTSTNMNANEVIARLAGGRLGRAVHPNDDVNRSQSSNDVIPTCVHASAAIETHERLLPAFAHLAETIDARAADLGDVVKTGRTHLMDAMPLTLAQELSGWSAQVRASRARIESTMPRLLEIAQGATAVGTGVNCPPGFADAFAADLARATGLAFVPAANRFAALAAQDTAVELSGQLNAAAAAFAKIANDLRWMNSGPLAGLGEISLPAVQPGSSIMPGKVNPVIAESAAMVCAQVAGNHVAITIAGQSGSFQLNVMLPLVAHNLLESIALLAAAARLLADRAIAGFEVNRERIEAPLARNPILVTALNDAIGYEAGAAVAKRAYAEGRPVVDVAEEMTGLDRAELERLLDPMRLTRG